MGDIGSAFSSGLSGLGSAASGAMSDMSSLFGGGGGGGAAGGLSSLFGGGDGGGGAGGLGSFINALTGGTTGDGTAVTPQTAQTTQAATDPGVTGGTQSSTTPGPTTPTDGRDGQAKIAGRIPAAPQQPASPLIKIEGAGAATPKPGADWPQALPGARPSDPVGTVEPLADTNNPPAVSQPARPVTPTPGLVRTGAQGEPITAAGTPAAETPMPPVRPADLGGDANVPAAGATETAGAGVPGAGATDASAAQGGLPPGAGNIIRDILGLALGGPQALPQLIGDFLGMAGGGQAGGMGEMGNILSALGGMGGMGGMGGDMPSPFAQDVGMWGRRRGRHGWMLPGLMGPGWRRAGYYPNGRGGWAFHRGGYHPGWGGGGRQWAGGGGNQPNAAPTGNRFIDAVVGAESAGKNIVSGTDRDSRGLTVAQGGNRNEVSQGYFQIQNHPGGTWQSFARRAGVDLGQYPSPMSAPFAIQHRVAQMIPINQWGPRTKAILHRQFGAFNERMTLGQLEQMYGGGVAGNFGGGATPASAPASPDGGDGSSLVGDISGGDEAFGDGEATAVATQ